MKAAVHYGTGNIRIEDVERPVPGDKRLLIKIKACGVRPLIDVPYLKMSFSNISIVAHHQEIGVEQTQRVALGQGFSAKAVETGSEVTGVGSGGAGKVCHPCFSLGQDERGI